MSHPFPQTKEKQEERTKKKKKNVTKEKSWEGVLRPMPELIQPHPRRACRLS